MSALEALHQIAENKPGSIFTSRDAQAVIAKLDEMSDAIIYLGGKARKPTKKAEVEYEAKIKEGLAEVMAAKP